MSSFAFRAWCFKTYKVTLKLEFNFMDMHTWTHIKLLSCSFINCYHQNLRDIVLKPTLVQHRPPEMVQSRQHEGASSAPTHSPFCYLPLIPLSLTEIIIECLLFLWRYIWSISEKCKSHIIIINKNLQNCKKNNTNRYTSYYKIRTRTNLIRVLNSEQV